MPDAPFNLALIDGVRGQAWAWHGSDGSFRQYPAGLGLVNCWLRRTGGTPLRTWRSAGSPLQALPLLSIAASGGEQPEPRPNRWALLLWRDGDPFGFVTLDHQVHRAGLSRSPDALAFYAEDAPRGSEVVRAETFALTLQALTARYGVGRVVGQRPALVC